MQKGINEQLQKIVDKHGIEVIKDFMNNYNKQKRKQNTKVNNYKEVAMQVYHLVMHYNYSKTKAIDEVAKIRDIAYNTTRNHGTIFDKEANQFDYYSFGYLVEDYDSWSGEFYNLCNLNNISLEIGEIYKYKYEEGKTKKINKNKKIDISKFKQIEKPIQQYQQSQSQSRDTNEIPF